MAEEIIFKVGVNTGNTAKDLDSIDKELKSISNTSKDMAGIDKRFDDLNKRVASGTMTMRESTKAIKEYQTIALQAGAESPVGQQAIANAAKLTDELGDLKTQINNAANDGRNMQAALQLGSGIAAGYGAVQGTMALVGVESENLQKTFVKLQAVQSVLAGIEQIRAILEKESFLMQKAKIVATKAQTAVEIVYAAAVGGTTGAMKALRLAMLSLPIVAIIAGIVALVAAIASFASEEEKAEAQNEALTKSYERQSDALSRSTSARQRELDNMIKLRTAQGASEEELHQLELDRLKESEIARVKGWELERRLMAQKQTQYYQALREGNEELATSIRGEVSQHRSKYQELKSLDGQYKNDKLVLEAEFKNKEAEKEEESNNKAIEKRKAREEAEKKRLEDEAKLRAEREKLMKDYMLASIEDEELQKLMILQESHKREEAELIAKFGKDTELLKQLQTKQDTELNALNEELGAQRKAAQDEKDKKAEADKLAKIQSDNLSARSRIEGELMNMQLESDLKRELQAELWKLEMEDALLNTDLTEGEIFKIKADYESKLSQLKKQKAEEDKQIQLDTINASTQIAAQGLNSIQSLSDAIFSAKMSKLEKGSAAELAAAKKQFEINKKLQIASAVISGVQGVINALTAQSVVPEPFGTILKAANAVAIGISTGANIAKIKNSKFEGGGSVSSSGGSVSAPSMPMPNVSEPSLTATAGLAGSGTTDTKPNKVYVLDSDITAQQNQSAKVQTLATFGG